MKKQSKCVWCGDPVTKYVTSQLCTPCYKKSWYFKNEDRILRVQAEREWKIRIRCHIATIRKAMGHPISEKEEKLISDYWKKRELIKNWEARNIDKKRESARKYRESGRKRLGETLRKWYGIWPSKVKGWFQKYGYLGEYNGNSLTENTNPKR